MKIFGSIIKNYKKKYIKDLDILLNVSKKPVKRYSKYACNYHYTHNKQLYIIYKKYRTLKTLGIDVFFTHDNKHYFQLYDKGDILYWGTLLKVGRTAEIKAEKH